MIVAQEAHPLLVLAHQHCQIGVDAKVAVELAPCMHQVRVCFALAVQSSCITPEDLQKHGHKAKSVTLIGKSPLYDVSRLAEGEANHALTAAPPYDPSSRQCKAGCLKQADHDLGKL